MTENTLFCYESVNKSCVKHIYVTTVRSPIYMICVAIILFTVCGNLFVVISIAHFKQLHTPTNFLVLSLAVADLLLGGFVMPPSMVRSLETCWYYGDLFCKIHSSIDTMLCTTSIFHLSFISIDRYYAVCEPLKYQTKITIYVALFMVVISWSVSAVIGFGLIFLELNIKGIEDVYYENIYCVGGCTLIQTEISSLIALGIVMGVFLCCWMPCFLTVSLDPIFNYSTPPVLFDTLVWLGYLNSTFNPLVYAFFYSWFRKALGMIVFGQIFQANSSRTKLITH
nr:PREDICTED: trace amine-associated receptor 1-like [Lepisosteus oculatus]